MLLNAYVAVDGVDSDAVGAARGMGMTEGQIVWRVELPLALPVIIAGLRTAAVEVIASGTLAAFIGAGGLGYYILAGIALADHALLLVGAIPVALLALLAEFALSRAQKAVTVPGF